MAVATTLIAPPFIKVLFAEDRDGDGKVDVIDEIDVSEEFSRIRINFDTTCLRPLPSNRQVHLLTLCHFGSQRV